MATIMTVFAKILQAPQKDTQGGFIMLDDYHRRGWWGNDVLRAVHDFIGKNAHHIRIHAVVGAQIILQLDEILAT